MILHATNLSQMWNPNISYRPSCSSSSSLNIPWYHKRKLKDDLPADLPPPKMLITEEKMVSALKGIHLSKDYTSHEGTSTSPLVDDGSSLVSLEEKQTMPTLFICDEIRALQKNVEPVLPKHIMDKFQKPNNALVLWQPPVGDLGRYLKTFTKENGDDDNEQPAEATAVTGDVEMNEEDSNNNSSSQDALGFFIRTV